MLSLPKIPSGLLEVLKITIVERIFHIGRDKLMTVNAFAWAYNFVSWWLTWIQALPPWQAVKRSFDVIRWVHKLSSKSSLALPHVGFSGIDPSRNGPRLPRPRTRTRILPDTVVWANLNSKIVHFAGTKTTAIQIWRVYGCA